MDLKRRIAEAQDQSQLDDKPWDRTVRIQILDLPKCTLKDLEVRLAALERAKREIIVR